MSEQWKEYLFIRWVIKQTVVIIKAYHFYQLHTTFIQHPAGNIKSICKGKLLGLISADLNIKGQLLTIYSPRT
jgi:hypothetical protein